MGAERCGCIDFYEGVGRRGGAKTRNAIEATYTVSTD